MNTPRKLGFLGKAALASTVLGAFLMFIAAGTASAQPVRYVAPRARVVVVHPGSHGRVVYYNRVVPAYRVYHRPYAYRYWDARFHCWRYR